MACTITYSPESKASHFEHSDRPIFQNYNTRIYTSPLQRETEAAVKIQTQVRARAARAQREKHRQRHAARVGSIRSSGRAAADDLRALSRPGTAAVSAAAAATKTAATTTVEEGGGQRGQERGEESTAVLIAAVDALLPISVSQLSPPSRPGSLSIPPTIELASVRTPSFVGSPAVSAASDTATAAATATSPSSAACRQSTAAKGSSRHGGAARVRVSTSRGKGSPGKDAAGRHKGSAPGSPSGSNNNSGSRGSSPSRVSASAGGGTKSAALQRGRNVEVADGGGRSRSPSTARYV